jgi:hypothetical protein
MNHDSAKTPVAPGLLANGSSGGWDIAVDESRDGRELTLELDGPQFYLAFQLRDAAVIV